MAARWMDQRTVFLPAPIALHTKEKYLRYFVCDMLMINICFMNQLRTMLMKQQKEDSLTLQGLQKRFDKLIRKYQEKKLLINQLAEVHRNQTLEMERLSKENQKILKEKHDAQRETAKLQNANYQLQLQINGHKQKMHELQSENVCSIYILYIHRFCRYTLCTERVATRNDQKT